MLDGELLSDNPVKLFHESAHNMKFRGANAVLEFTEPTAHPEIWYQAQRDEPKH